MSKLLLRFTEEQLADYKARNEVRVHRLDGPQELKYHNKPFRNEEGFWHSKGEWEEWCKLKLREKAGQIQKLERQVSYDLAPACILDGKRMRPVRYLADFRYIEAGKTVVHDHKGFKDRLYRIKRHLMKTVHGIEVLET